MQPDLSPRSRPMFHAHIQKIPTGTRGFPGDVFHSHRYKMFRVEHGGLGDPVPWAHTKYSKRNAETEEKEDENYEKIA